MSPTPPPKLEAYIFFDNQADRPLFLRFSPRDGILIIHFFDFPGEETVRLDQGRMLTIPVTPAIRACLRDGKLGVNIKFHIRTPEPKLEMHMAGPVRDLLGRSRGPIFRITVHMP